ncbi:MAG: PC4/YdbC family ssDNA-binding protein [Oscillospiraceae bacterium]|nr:PC4/YdbC family ssDNA-binding protein [Oscillospiraceae bacterium]
MPSNAEFKFEVVKTLGVVSEGKNGWKKELNLVSWSNRPAKYDIREWNEDHTQMRKGITLTDEEIAVLKEILDEIDL